MAKFLKAYRLIDAWANTQETVLVSVDEIALIEYPEVEVGERLLRIYLKDSSYSLSLKMEEGTKIEDYILEL